MQNHKRLTTVLPVILPTPNRSKTKVAKQSIVERGEQLQDEPVLIEEYVELWVDTQYDSKD